MSSTALVITVAYAIAVVIGSVISFAVYASTRAADHTTDTQSHARRETVWLVVVLLGLFALLMATIFYVPYGESAGANPQRVRVTGVQYAWAIDVTELRAGIPVEFLATAEDVSHGFGVYNEDDVLLFQVQVIPKETQKVVYTFKKPGTYKVLCLEFCGAKHHEMVSSFEVRG